MDWTAVAGIIGVLLGAGLTQAIQVWRWKQEAGERKRLANLEDRKTAYMDFLQFLDPWKLTANEIVRERQTPMAPQDADELFLNEAMPRLVKISLLAPPDVSRLASINVSAWYLLLAGQQAGDDTAMHALFKTQGDFNELLQAFREDLGVETAPIHRPIVHKQS